jgi:2-oxoglutarate dehydrogenase E2 component (dihydrolipoamide succinyltransferase)
MPFEIRVPDLGESIVEATIARWLKQEGESVKVGEPVVVLETDKVDLEVGAEKDGVLNKITHQAGDDVKVGEILGIVDESAVASSNGKAAKKTENGSKRITTDASKAAESTPNVKQIAEQSATLSSPNATPVAARMAQQKQIDLAKIQPSGASGRVTKGDVERYLQTRSASPSAVTALSPAGSELARRPEPTSYIMPMSNDAKGRREERVKMSRRRRTIAQRLVEAQRTAAMLTTFNEVDMSKVMEIRERRKTAFKDKYGVSLGLSSFFVKASVGALKAFPRVNAEIQNDEMILKYYYDIGVAIGAEEGLVVPVLRDADQMSFAIIETTIKDFAKQAQDGTLSLESLRGGTFTITNGGVFGSLMSTPILNPPQVGILGLHAIKPRPVVIDDHIVIRPMMYIALSYDHRIIDGREAVQFLVKVKELVEDPESLLLEG